jgi:hypothetical protein
MIASLLIHRGRVNHRVVLCWKEGAAMRAAVIRPSGIAAPDHARRGQRGHNANLNEFQLPPPSEAPTSPLVGNGCTMCRHLSRSSAQSLFYPHHHRPESRSQSQHQDLSQRSPLGRTPIFRHANCVRWPTRRGHADRANARVRTAFKGEDVSGAERRRGGFRSAASTLTHA